MAQRIFGQLPGILEGDIFTNRVDLHQNRVHRPLQAGISGSGAEGADSIVLSGKYEDDEDHGDVIIYTGQGGRELSTGRQVADQVLAKGNLALAFNCQHGLPVRVIRGAHYSPFAPFEGYRYDGLYRVTSYWKDQGRSGFIVWRFQLEKIIPTQPEEGSASEPSVEYQVKRVQTTIQRIVRDTELAQQLKRLYRYQCQVCNQRLVTRAGVYAEAAHIQPLGAPHHGPDVMPNLICLCPNHHVLFDFGAFGVADNFSLLGLGGQLRVFPQHQLDIKFLRYHRSHFYEPAPSF